MDYKETMSNLNDKEKIHLAAQLTIAAMGFMSFNTPPSNKETLDIQSIGAADLTAITFKRMLKLVSSDVEPPYIPPHFWD